MEFQEILLERDGGSAIVTLNRPERRNALSLRMLQELTACGFPIDRHYAVTARSDRKNDASNVQALPTAAVDSRYV